MKQLFPIRHVMGYVFSLILSVVALAVIFWDMSFAMGMTILLVCAAIQASVQLFLFMHATEDKTTKTSNMANLVYALFVGLVTVFGTLFTMIWGYQ
ncbi:cytochrome aa3 quinol oxidase subunit IV [Paenibacillus thiaminolyticus]|uniref:Quinol oxidase subunit 4 n=1 Tax=Paenibacillus thiaminolyticus TaxID=49283 RepID=A0AAP9DV16_PANTH|nr:cytochrome aa3 quinol oxidase subunit IV [Paenibacillus thiaminolyticus]MCY9534574.1 cytochrome aa3 quinol oxidase subunit IV [Paenibacillus thiaminolyticus]MCY9600176.1 cytochrome aa3 quinol oxidase subunit IV [Paenibacillus thiaminolyticus]MCY9608542.1 cytochrome aa3 quinol oxidase subunit IV [Paenibacillus thiaminolyticus]MCY9615166.1 cytochrome aa3 quinol oxidase subunit IV [Paenibacillus thiaminolyticus]MCY9620626.1 cytochrome aa3 quinol oxidase subunit IV [Paenibacillus thiaminolyticu